MGSSQEGDELWNGVCGKHGVERMNTAGLFLATLLLQYYEFDHHEYMFGETRHLQVSMATPRYQAVALQ